jgi:predicted nucleotidyltransferase
MTSALTAASDPALPEAVRRLVARLGAEPGVRRVVLFGSRARGDAGPRSDVDLAVEAPGLSAHEWLRLTDMAEEVDTLLSIDLVRLEEAPEELRARIESEGRTLHER